MEEMTTLLLQPPPPDPRTEFINSKLNDKGNLWLRGDSDETLMVTQQLRDYRGQRLQGINIVLQQRGPTSNLSPLILENVAYFLRNHDFANFEIARLTIFGDVATTTEQQVDALVEALCDNIRVSGVGILVPAPPSPRVIHRLIQEKSNSPQNSSYLGLYTHPRSFDDSRNQALKSNTSTSGGERPKNFHFHWQGNFPVTNILRAIHATNLLRAIVTSQANAVDFKIQSDDFMNSFQNDFLSAGNINVPDLRFRYLVPRDDDAHQDHLNIDHDHHHHRGTAVYHAAVHHRAVKTIVMVNFSFGALPPIINMHGHQNPQQQHQQQCVDNNDPLEKVSLHNCNLLGREAAHILSLRPIKAFQLSGKVDSDVPDHGEFWNDFFQSQPLLCELILGGTKLGADTTTSLCHHLTRPDCHLKKLCLSRTAFKDECVTIFFDQLAAAGMPSLQYLEFDCFVTSPQVANAIAAGFKSNSTLHNVKGLKLHALHQRAPRLKQEIEFLLRCYVSGRYLVTGHMDNPGDDGGIPIGLVLFPKVMFRCLSSNQNHNDVVFFFLRQAMPSLVNRLDVRRSRRREPQF